MTRGLPEISGSEKTSPSIKISSVQNSFQRELFALKTLVEIPDNVGRSAEVWGHVIADDTHHYIVKGSRGGEHVPASEWLATRIAEMMNLPCATPKIIQLNDGDKCFGSRQIVGVNDVAVTSQLLTTPTTGPQATPVFGLKGLLSSIYAFDMFINNVDRHVDNFISVDDGGHRRLFAIDFARSFFWHGSLPIAFPISTQPTRRTGRLIRSLHGFDTEAALATVDKLSQFAPEMISWIMNEMPEQWLSISLRQALLNWWSHGARMERLDELRKGLSDGTLL